MFELTRGSVRGTFESEVAPSTSTAVGDNERLLITGKVFHHLTRGLVSDHRADRYGNDNIRTCSAMAL